MSDTHFIKKSFVRQHDSSDCGVACLRSVLRFYGGDISLEQLRELSGTSTQGTTLLGLYEAAGKIGFDAEGCEAEIPDLKEHNQPTILHVLVEGNLEHYVLWYGYSTKYKTTDKKEEANPAVHLIGDPAMGIIELSDEELGAIWQAFFSRLNRMVYGVFQDHIFDLSRIQLRLNVYASIAGVVILICILAYTSYQVLQGNLKTGELMAILGMSSSLLPSVASLALLAVPINEARIAFERMFEFTSLEPEPVVTEQENSNFTFESLQINNITFRFPGRKALLSDFSLHIKKGEIVGIIGESGCGKTTLIQIIERFYAPESGKITVNDFPPLHAISLSSWRDRIATVPQEVYMFNGTIIENILLGKEPNEGEIRQFFEQEPFLSFTNTLPQGLSTLVGE